MATPQLFYLTKQSANFPSLRSEESSEADIKLLVKQLCQESERIERQVGHGAELVCNLAHNNLTCEHLYFLTKLLLESDVHLFALDLSWNRIFVSTWHAFLPTVTQLLKIAKHVDFAGNYLPA